MSSPRPIRTKLLRILVLPLVSMVALWGVIAYASIQELTQISRTQSRWQTIGSPVLQLVYELQRERQASALAGGATGGNQALADQRRATDEQVKRLRQLATPGGVRDAETPGDVRALLGGLESLRSLRQSADSGTLSSPLRIIEAYDRLIDDAYRQLSDEDTLSDVPSYRAVRGMAAYIAAAEYLSRENAVLTSAVTRGYMSPADRAAFVAAMTGRRIAMADAGRDLKPTLGVHYENLARSLPHKRLSAVEDRILNWNSTGAPPLDTGLYKSDADLLLQSIVRDTQYELFWSEEQRQADKVSAYWRIGLILGIGLLAVVASILLSYRFGLSLIRELRRLQNSAAEMAERRLPRLVERLRRGDDVDPATEAPELESAGTAEVERLVEAFSAVQRTAVGAAVDQAKLRKGVGQVFLNLAWRNQALLHRQLTLLDTMERRVEEPDILEDLFRLDHLTTRMRRHAENLVILSDATPARRWRDPVSIFDVVRSAVLEVEDYTRVIVPPMPQAPPLLGVAVADVIHLVAELVENATVFSPPETSVAVRGMTAANGFALEVEDRGLGLSQHVLDELNAKLANPPEFDLVDSDRLGLFVVARLAARHGIKISLRRSPYEGTTAIVLLPPSLLAIPEPLAPAAAPGHAETVTWDPAVPTEGPTTVARHVKALTTASPTAPRALHGVAEPSGADSPNGRYGHGGPGGDGGHGGNGGPGGSGGPGGPGGPDGQGGYGGNGGHGGPGLGDWPQGPVGYGTPGDDRPVPVLEPPSDWFQAVPRTSPGSHLAAPVHPATPPTPAQPGTAATPVNPAPQAAPAEGSAGTSFPRPQSFVPSTEDDDLDGLPVRVRQANMAPQLRRARAAEQRDVTARSPEELFTIMSSMQRGWKQGRGEAGQK
ncbi:sensor histidine kinase [Sphaerisporangium sp. B11E5]|uniref:sensor histidine kinase n=1 Tax=Sphaerisporangium sp. B11E5 TaxID=3153563 RepID=UPI00325D8B26